MANAQLSEVSQTKHTFNQHLDLKIEWYQHPRSYPIHFSSNYIPSSPPSTRDQGSHYPNFNLLD